MSGVTKMKKFIYKIKSIPMALYVKYQIKLNEIAEVLEKHTDWKRK